MGRDGELLSLLKTTTNPRASPTRHRNAKTPTSRPPGDVRAPHRGGCNEGRRRDGGAVGGGAPQYRAGVQLLDRHGGGGRDAGCVAVQGLSDGRTGLG